MAGAEWAVVIRELRVAFFLSQNHVQVVVFAFAMLFMLTGFHFFRRLGDLADANRGCEEEGKTQDREHQPGNASYAIAKHDL